MPDVRVTFTISGSGMDFGEVTACVGVDPTSSSCASPIQQRLGAPECVWALEVRASDLSILSGGDGGMSGYSSLMLALDELIGMFFAREEAVRDYCASHNFEAAFDVVVWADGCALPRMDLSPGFMQFAALLGADIDFNIYVDASKGTDVEGELWELGSAEEFSGRVFSGSADPRLAHASKETWFSVMEAYPEFRLDVAMNKYLPVIVEEVLAGDCDVEVRRGIAWKYRLPDSVLDVLVSDSDPLVRQMVARRSDLPSQFQEILSNDSVPDVRRALADSAGMTDDIGHRLLSDSDRIVAITAAATLSSRGMRVPLDLEEAIPELWQGDVWIPTGHSLSSASLEVMGEPELRHWVSKVTWIRCVLTVFGQVMDVEEVSAKFGVTPTRVLAASSSQMRFGAPGFSWVLEVGGSAVMKPPMADDGAWEYPSVMRPLASLLDLLVDHADDIREYCDRHCLGVRLVIAVSVAGEELPYVEVTSEAVDMIARLGASVHFDIHAESE